MKKMNKLFALLLAAALLFTLAACGKGEDKPEVTPTPEMVYASEFTAFPEAYSRSEANFNIFYTDENGFVGSVNEKVGEREPFEGEVAEYDGQFDIFEPRLYTMDYSGKMTKLAYTPLKPETEHADAEVGSWIAGVAPMSSGYAVLEEVYVSWSDAPGGVERYSEEWYQYQNAEDNYYIRLLDAEGRELRSAAVDLDYLRSQEEYFNPYRFVLLEDGTLLTSGEKSVFAFDSESGNYLYKIDGNFDWIMNLIRLRDGTVYVAGYGMNAKGSYDPQLCELDVKNHKIDAPLNTTGNFYQAMPGNDRYLIFYTDGSYFCGLDKETLEEIRLFNWTNVDVFDDELNSFAVLSDGTVVGLLLEWDKNYENATRTLVTVREVPSSSLPQKTVLTLASDGLDWNVRRELIRFNRASETTRIELLDYSQYDNYETDYDENGYGENGGMTKLRTEILSGKMPDILDLARMPVRQLAAKDLLLDLYPLLDADPELSRNDIFPNVLRALEIDGKLSMISSGFYIQTCIGAKRVVGDKPGWTYRQLNEALATMPEGCSVFSVGMTRDTILDIMMELDLGQFVDWKTGKVSFDSQAFVDLLNFIKSFPAAFDWEKYEWTEDDSDYNRIREGRQLLLNYGLSGFSDLGTYESVFGGPDSFTFIGYPTSEGVGNLLRIDSGFAISRDCKDAQAAWQFLRTLLTEKYEEDNVYNFPVNRNVFEKQKKDAMTPTYVKDEDGNILLDPETGEKQMETKGWSVDFETMEDIPIYSYTAEQIAVIEQVIASTDRVPDSNKALVDIVREQAQAFFAGQRSAEEVAKLVQSKANIYVNEQR